MLLPPAHRGTTATVRGLYPFMAAGASGTGGVYIGRDLHGGAFTYDPWLAYQARLLGSPNLLVAGQLGRGKSALVKTYLYRQQVFGRRAWVLDPKGEYHGLAAAAGTRPLALRPGGQVRLNPLEAGRLAHDESPHELELRQLRLLTALAEGALARSLAPGEHTACQQALAAARARTSEPTIPAVVEHLLDPDQDAARGAGTTPARLADESREAALALRRLVHGDLAGMFDGPTTPGLDLDAGLVVLDLSAVHASTALGLLLTCTTAALQARLTADGASKRIVVIDEAWAVLADLGVARWMRAAFKLARQYGVQHIAVLHRLSDLDAAGAEGTEQGKHARGLLHDTETRVLYGQRESEVPTTTRLLGLSTTEAELLPTLGPGIALWRVGTRVYLVQHRLGRHEHALVDTDTAMT